MCLTIKGFETRQAARDFFKNPKIATKNIKVYKVLRNNNSAPCRYFQYEKGMHYYQEGKAFSARIYRIGDKHWHINIYRGLHSGKTQLRLQSFFGYGKKYVKMIIPKGSKYFLYNNLYVSDNLIYPL